MQVTVTGGAGRPPATLTYPNAGIDLRNAEYYARVIDTTYQTAIYYNPNHPPPAPEPTPAYLIIQAKYANTVIDARGFGAVVDENSNSSSTVIGGGAPHGQTVLASDGGLTYSALIGNNTVLAGGGDNRITFQGPNGAGDMGSVAAYTGAGNDTLQGGDGHTTISAGHGHNKVFLYDGQSLVFSSGHDTVYLRGNGSDTIEVRPGGSDLVRAGQSDPGLRLHFDNGANASTVLSGAGSYTIFGNAGGGVFHGGTGGDNFIKAGSGDASIFGGGAGDTLIGGSGSDTIETGMGNETLVAGSGKDILNLTIHDVTGTSGNGTTDTITGFNKMDLLNVGGASAIDFAMDTYHVVGGNGTFSLLDGTKVVLDGFDPKHLTASDFKH